MDQPVPRRFVCTCAIGARPLGSRTGEDVMEIVEKITLNVRLDEICCLEKKKNMKIKKKNILMVMVMVISHIEPPLHKPN